MDLWPASLHRPPEQPDAGRTDRHASHLILPILAKLTPPPPPDILAHFEVMAPSPETGVFNGFRITTTLNLSHRFLNITDGQDTFTS